VFAALAAPPPASAEPPGAAPRPFAGAGETGMAGMGTGQEASARRSHPPAQTDGPGGFLFRHDRFTPLAAVPGAGPQLHYALNDRRDIAGFYVDAGAGLGPDGFYPPEAVHGFVRDRWGRVTSFDVPDGTNPVPQGIDDRGRVAGIYLDANLVQTGFVRDRNGDVTTIALSAIGTKARDVNDRGQVVGIYGDPADNELGFVVRSYLRDRDGTVDNVDIPGSGETSPYAIDDRGRIVGSYTDAGVTTGTDDGYPPGTLHAYIQDRHGVTTLDAPGSVATVALDINDRGQVVGGYIDATGRQHGFLYDHGRYTTIDAPRPLDPLAMGSIATGINDPGDIVVPEPAIALVPPRA
jgi:probable HAF family extracellular repeat protein